MSRFNNPKALPLMPPPRGTNGVNTPPRPLSPAASPVSAAVKSRPAPFQAAAADPRSNMMPATCFAVLCLYLLSCYANEFAFRLFSGQAYISTVTVILLPLCWIATGAAFQGFRLRLGKWFLGFGVWLGVCVPVSVWRGNAVSVVSNYYF